MKGAGKGGLPSTLEPAPKITEAASALAGKQETLESQPSSKAATQRDDSPHVSAESSSASSSGPPEPAKEEGPRGQAVNGPAISFEDGTEDGEGSEDLSNKLELDTFDYRTFYLNDLRNRDSDTEPTIYGSDSESSDEGF